MSLIIAKNKVEFEQLKKVKTPDSTDSFTPIPHSQLVELTRQAISLAGLEVKTEEHALARDGLRYFGGFAVTGKDVESNDRQAVIGLRNSGDKSFAAAICLGTSILVCENLCFSSQINLARRHTVNILNDLPRVLADAVSRLTQHWSDMNTRFDAYKQTECKDVERIAVSMADCKAIPARDIYNVITEFRNPRHAEFKGGSLWSLYNSVTENLKSGDLSKLPFRTAMVQSILDPLAKLEKSDAGLILAN